MLKVFWFSVYYGKTRCVNVQFAPDIDTAYAQERRASIALPIEHNRKYPRARAQPVATRIQALRPPSREYLETLDKQFAAYLDEARRVLENDSGPS